MLNDPRFTAEVELTVPFHDVDMMGVVWHGNYFRYFEIAREALLNQFNYGYRQMKESGYLWPVVDTRVKYRDVLTFEQRFRVRARLEEYENRLRIGYEIVDAASGKRTTTGYTIQVAVEEKSREMSFVSPDILFERMGVTP
ncbi:MULTISPECIES: thioesterase family protein [Raoultella]|uniref:Acyl-CoA thioester hydrolase n=2 Tax=Raoultella TaxID=160674 RepID=A0ABD7QII9_RAOOR|nr:MULTISPECIES: thioesterase family protein [Raoultella]AJF70683.1 4-hydroxybenzoyl-CoA thioesterase [Raoultella ornithinolytica]VUD29299.1 4-hydroxybenzoyl-CoA thioesterase [Raoultella sp. NCTC 9187]MCE9899934.1 acyl-CoA thioesterase [Raoultella terrigena]MCI1031857.1 acyl-CoA thioesterase [Raoultella terrigena]MCS4272820.1 acyl-CoA thioester hydrolase [Raoultella sp. BIGb0132]